MKVVIEIELNEKLVGLFENKMKDYGEKDLDKFIREDMDFKTIHINFLDTMGPSYRHLDHDHHRQVPERERTR